MGGIGSENSILNTSDSEDQKVLTHEQPSAIDILKDKMKVKKTRNLIDALQSSFKQRVLQRGQQGRVDIVFDAPTIRHEILQETNASVKFAKMNEMLRQIFMFFEVHQSFLNYLCHHCITIDILQPGEKVDLKAFARDMDFVYVYSGQLKVSLTQNYTNEAHNKKEKPRVVTNKFIMNKESCINPLVLESLMEEQGINEPDTKLIHKVKAIKQDTVIIRLPNQCIRSFFDPSPEKDHLNLFSARSFEEIIKDAMGGFYGINAKQRKLIDNAFEFVVTEPSKILQKEED